MPSKKERDLAKEYITRTLQLSQAFEAEANRVNRDVRELHDKVINKIEREFGKIYSNEKMRELSNSLADDIVNYYNNGVLPTVDTAFASVISREIAWNSGVLAAFTGATVYRLNSAKVAANALKKTYQGHTFEYWFKAHVSSEWKRTAAVLQNGYIQGATTGDVVKEVGKILHRSDSDIKTLTRSYMQHAASEARTATFDDNDDLIESIIWLATLDARTTPDICGLRDGKEWTKDHKPIGHNLEWGAGPGRIHFNCRSAPIPKLKDTPDLANMFNRPAINAGSEYESGDNKTKNGKPRKPTKGNIENGIFKVTNVKGTTHYEDYLRRQKTAYVSDILGKEYAKDFKAGRLTLSEYAKKKGATINQL